MILVDRALEERERAGDPIRVGMIGAGFMARGVALQISKYTRGMELVAISNRTLQKAHDAFSLAGIDGVDTADDAQGVSRAVAAGRPVVTHDPLAIAQAQGIDVLVEVTGTIGLAAEATLAAIETGKHVVLMNAELDGTLGPILKDYADRAGVVITNADGDQPGVLMNLYRFVRGIGVRPVLCGNIKGLHDPYRTPETQAAFAAQWGQSPEMVTSFADGTKISFEQAIVANATGMRVARRGMFGPAVPSGTPIMEAASWYPLEEMLEGPGIVDYVVGAVPGPGVFVLGTHEDPMQKHYLNLYKLGEGPLYVFYTPYHLCHFEVPNTIARAVLFGDAAIAPDHGLRVEVVATAKRDLAVGEVIDGLGGFMSYGLAENAGQAAAEGLLPIGLAEGCTLVRAVAKDAVLARDDVEIPPGRMADRLRAEQDARVYSVSS